MTARKVVLIGAGSASFTRGLVADMMLTGDPWNIHLVDVNPENLEVAHGVVQRMIAARPSPVTVTARLHTLGSASSDSRKGQSSG